MLTIHLRAARWIRALSLIDSILLGCLSLIIAILAHLLVENYTLQNAAQETAQNKGSALQSELEEALMAMNQQAYEMEDLKKQYETLATDSAILELQAWKDHRELYAGLQEKVKDFESQGVTTTMIKNSLPELATLLIEGKYEELTVKVNESTKVLNLALETKKKADAQRLVAQAAAPQLAVGAAPSGGYSRVGVQTSRGTFTTDVVSVDLNAVQVVTVTGNESNCDNDCGVKPLAAYIAEQGGFAGINGTYFCPPDYSSCAGKINSYDFPVFGTPLGRWINADKLFWNDRAMMAFTGSSSRFCRNANGCDSGGVSAGLVNYPALVDGGNVVVNEGALSDNLRTVKGVRGAIGVSGSTLYLLVIRGASVPDAAYVLQALGVKQGMNLDGGGSTALYYNGYKAGPGRNLPNAIVIKSR